MQPTTCAILDVLLSVSFPGRDALAVQAANVEARAVDDDGCVEFRVAGPPAAVVRRVPVEAEVDDADGVMVHLLLHVDDGHMDELEVYREDGGRLRGPINVDRLRVVVLYPTAD